MDTNTRPLAVSQQQGVAITETDITVVTDRSDDSGIYRFYCIVQEPYFLTMQNQALILIHFGLREMKIAHVS